MLIMEAWSYMELSDSDLKLRFFLLIWLFKWQLGALDISDSDSAGWTATEHRNRDGSIYHWVCMYVVCCFSC
jgi:hypothetical protein